MSTRKSRRASGPGRALRKTFVSGFVLASYIAYAIHEHMAVSAQAVAATVPPTPRQGQGAQQQDQSAQQLGRNTQSQSQDATTPNVLGQNVAAPTATPQVTDGSSYKDGTYTGASADAFYGQVQVQVVISGGRIKSVTFLDYPRDRRTSARINSFAVPYLQSEAVQAQSANVDLISGATLTSEAFMESLQSALDSARG